MYVYLKIRILKTIQMCSINVWGQTIVYGLLKDGNIKILIFFFEVLLNYIKSLIKNLSTYFIDDILYELHLNEKLKKQLKIGICS